MESSSKSNSPTRSAVATSGNVLVVCRFRPLNAKEKEMGTKPCCDFAGDKKQVKLNLT